MGVLHLLSRSPYESLSPAQCLSRAGAGDAVLLLEAGVYAALRGGAGADLAREAMGRGVAVYAVEADLAARGIAEDERLEGVAAVDYEGFVDLCLLHAPVVTWA